MTALQTFSLGHIMIFLFSSVITFINKITSGLTDNYRGFSFTTLQPKYTTHISSLHATWKGEDTSKELKWFPKNRYRIGQILTVRKSIEVERIRTLTAIPLFMDFSKVFNSIYLSGSPSKSVESFIYMGSNVLPMEVNVKIIIGKSNLSYCSKNVNVNGSLSEPGSVDNGVKQGDIPAPTLLSIYFFCDAWTRVEGLWLLDLHSL